MFIKNILKLIACICLGLILPRVGALLNDTAINANKGLMPVWCLTNNVAFSVFIDPMHYPLTKDTKYTILTDVMPYPTLYIHHGWIISDVLSVGDLCMFSGFSLFFVGSFLLILYLIYGTIVLFYNLLGKVYEKYKI